MTDNRTTELLKLLEERDALMYDAGVRNGIRAVFQQLEEIEDYEDLQDLIAEYWAEGEGYDEP